MYLVTNRLRRKATHIQMVGGTYVTFFYAVLSLYFLIEINFFWYSGLE